MTAVRLAAALVAVVAAAACVCPTTADEITSLPGLNTPLNFKQYSGYIPVDEANGRALFYWFVESQNNPRTDPVIVWFQGGPGCSGMVGMFMEHGPFHVLENGTVVLRNLSWNKFANVLYLDSPAGVGFSYSNTSSDYSTNDTFTAIDNYAFLSKWYTVFPQFADNDLFLAGESYGGNYVPQLWQLILAGSDGTLLKAFKGAIIGNPVFSCPWSFNAVSNYVQGDLYYWHGLIPYSSYQQWTSHGCNSLTPPNLNECNNLMNDMNTMIGTFSGDDLYTDFCTGNSTLGIDTKQAPGPTCDTIGNNMLAYLQRADVVAALHARPPVPYAMCSNILNYTITWPSSMPAYEAFFAAKLKLLIYSGDVDVATCPSQTTQFCLAQFTDRQLVTAWQPWIVEGQTAGYVEVYDRYTYATVKGAGHEVPQFLPFSAYTMVSRWLSQGHL